MEEIISCNICYKTYFEKGIISIEDLMDEYGNFMNNLTFRIKYNIKQQSTASL